MKMKKEKSLVIVIQLLFFVFVSFSFASLLPFYTYTGPGAGISIDAVGLQTNSEGTIQAKLPDNAIIQAAYLYSVSVWDWRLYDVIFDGNTMSSDSSSRLDVGSRNANAASENRWDVTEIVRDKYDGTGGIYDFSIKETGYLDGEILAIIYSVPNDPIRSVLIFDGECATTGDTLNIYLSNPYDGSSDVIMSVGISFGYQTAYYHEQYSQIDVNGKRLTSSAGGQDDGYGENGGLITVGDFNDDPSNPPDPYSHGTNYNYDDELYNISSFMTAGDRTIFISTLNPSNDDNIFFLAISLEGAASPNPNPVPELATGLLLAAGLGLIPLVRRKKK